VDGCVDELRSAQTLYNRFISWSRPGVFDRIFAGLTGKGPKPERIMVDAMHLKDLRTASGDLTQSKGFTRSMASWR